MERYKNEKKTKKNIVEYMQIKKAEQRRKQKTEKRKTKKQLKK